MNIPLCAQDTEPDN